jgi:hypothetical protein
LVRKSEKGLKEAVGETGARAKVEVLDETG